MWKRFLTDISPVCEFFPPADPTKFAEAEAALELRFPDEARSILQETNGIHGEYGLGLFWPLERIAGDNLKFRRNQDFRRLYMPFDHLLFFADAGNGDQFALSILDGEVRRPDVFVWDHESDSRTWVAGSIKQYFDWWLTGKIRL